jgi:hypothetical protein
MLNPLKGCGVAFIFGECAASGAIERRQEAVRQGLFGVNTKNFRKHFLP